MALVIKYFIFLTHFISFYRLTLSAELDFKLKFKEDLGVELKKYQTELMQRNIRNLAELYSTLSNELKPSIGRRFAEYLPKILALKAEIENGLTPETVLAIKNFTIIASDVMFQYRMSNVIRNDKVQQSIFLKALQHSEEQELKAINEFVSKLKAKWLELFQTIPKVELNTYKDLTEINAALESIFSTHIESLEDSTVVWKPLRKLADYFQYTEIQAMLGAEEVTYAYKVLNY